MTVGILIIISVKYQRLYFLNSYFSFRPHTMYDKSHKYVALRAVDCFELPKLAPPILSAAKAGIGISIYISSLAGSVGSHSAQKLKSKLNWLPSVAALSCVDDLSEMHVGSRLPDGRVGHWPLLYFITS